MKLPSLLLLGVLAAVNARAAVRISDEVLEAVGNGERVAVVVALREPVRRGKAAFARTEAIDAAESRVLERLGGDSFQLRARWVHAAGFAGELSIGALDALASDDDVLRVDVDRGGTTTLARSVPLIGADVLHARGWRGDGASVAVIDTGVEANHPDLAGAVVDERCYCRTASGAGCCPNGSATQTGAGAAADANGHGTHVCGIVASRGKVAPVGVAPGAKLVVARVTDANGTWAYTSQLLSAMDWIMTSHPEVRAINVSLGTGNPMTQPCDTLTADTILAASQIAELRRRGTAVIISSGNDASSTGIGVPGCLSGAWTVGSVYTTDYGGLRWPEAKNCTDFQTGADVPVCSSDGNAYLDFYAPGATITSDGLHGTTAQKAGTSMAAPHVAAAAALLFATKPSATVDEVEAVLKETGKPITDPRNGVTTPRIDLEKAAAKLLPPKPAGPRRRVSGK